MIEINPKYVEWIKRRFEKPLKITDKPHFKLWDKT